MRARTPAAAAIVATLLVSAPLAGAGEPDPGFGTDGKVVTSYAERSSSVWAVALQRDGKILAAGAAWSEDDEDVGGVALSRYNPDGSLDVGFGIGGTVTTDAGYAQAVAIQSDGKILVGGGGLARYTRDGALDTTFGAGGMVDTAFTVVRVIGTRRGILAVGTRGEGRKSTLVLARYRLDGRLDGRFGKRGVVTRAGYGPLAAAPAPGGKVVALSPRAVNPECASPSGCVNPDIDIRLLRFLPDGRLDRTFGGSGIVVRRARAHSTGLRALAVQPDGKVVVGGHGHAAPEVTQGFMLVRFREDGAIDRTFGDGTGVAVADVGFGTRALAVDPRGDIVAAGASMNLQDFVVTRFCGRACGRWPAGALDETFGVVTTDFGAYETPWAVVVQSDGAVVAAGQTGTGLLVGTDFALARYR